mgnify:CR=1 FL=1
MPLSVLTKIRFVCSMPRSGSTLLCNLLAQNPRFYAGHTSGLIDVLFNLRNHWEGINEHKAHPMPESKKNVLKAAMAAYYQHLDKDIIFDKSRGWWPYLELTEEILGKKAKLLVNVRPIPDICASFEKLHRLTSKQKQPPGERGSNYYKMQTIEGRVDFWLRNDQTIGISLNRLNDAIHRGYKDRMHFIHYDKFTQQPKETMKAVYDFLEEPFYDHNYDYVEQVSSEDDAIHGYVDLHKISNKIEYRPSDAAKILGPEVMKKFTQTKNSPI